ncbi:MAG: hypothetical protein QOJ92_604 [Frankiales bacterium]|nr:hypothetical protein [Frankiales bacterium]
MRVAQRARWPLVLCLLGLGWLLSPDVVPIYDGLTFPQDPYRYVGATPTPTTARATVSLRAGTNPGGVILNSAERGPQVQLYVAANALRAGASSSAVDLSVTPEAMTGSTTPDAPASNVYRFAAPPAVTLTDNHAPIQVTLRAAVHKSPPVMYYRSGPTDRWQRLATRGLGHASFNATAPGFGDYVLVRGTGSGAASDARVFVVVGMLLVVSLVSSALLVLRRRGRVG